MAVKAADFTADSLAAIWRALAAGLNGTIDVYGMPDVIDRLSDEEREALHKHYVQALPYTHRDVALEQALRKLRMPRQEGGLWTRGPY